MSRIVDHPFLVFAVSVVALWLSAYVGDFISKQLLPLRKGERDYFGVILTASLTLLARLLIGLALIVAAYGHSKAEPALTA